MNEYLRLTTCNAILLLCALARPVAAQTPDSSITQLLGHLLRSQLRSAGWRDTLVWQPSDSASSTLLRRLKLGPHDTIVPAGSQTMHCPGSTDSSWTAFAQPVGYVVYAQIRLRDRNSAFVDVGVSCQDSFRGRRRGFMQKKSWLVAKGRNGQRVYDS